MNKVNSQILIIEDDPVLSNNLKTLLEEEGYKVAAAENGKVGLKYALNFKPDLIICDILMPGLSGFDVKKELNKYDNSFDIPLLFLTAKTEMTSLREGMELGAEDYIFKPYKASNLLKIVKLRIEKKQRVIAKIIEENKNQRNTLESPNSILINQGNKNILLNIISIKAIMASNQYSNILMENGKTFLVRQSLNDWEKKLPKKNFQRIHRSTIVNIKFLEKIEKSKVYLKNYSEPLDISRRFLTEFKEKFKS
ncbi:MAG: response regulator transcription factor [Ignavibacteriae bacterium]|nr:response regulator transcription factor [Ignavibacteriota bacterium]MCB9208328.1 response regulator transcription factor [Ignavibacteriales bacterium]MCB9259090.1 response regulator transcription factor [Ignavibacteriales bacterium]